MVEASGELVNAISFVAPSCCGSIWVLKDGKGGECDERCLFCLEKQKKCSSAKFGLLKVQPSGNTQHDNLRCRNGYSNINNQCIGGCFRSGDVDAPMAQSLVGEDKKKYSSISTGE